MLPLVYAHLSFIQQTYFCYKTTLISTHQTPISSPFPPLPTKINKQHFMDSTRPCFVEEDDGLTSIADIETGFSTHNENCLNHHPLFSSRTTACGYVRRASFRSFSSLVSSPRSARFYDARCDDFQPHFLEACFLCKKPLGGNRDIFMYRGDTPFCSEECRQEQIEIDESKEKKWNLSSAMKALRNKDQRKSSSPSKSEGCSSHTGTVAAA